MIIWVHVAGRYQEKVLVLFTIGIPVHIATQAGTIATHVATSSALQGAALGSDGDQYREPNCLRSDLWPHSQCTSLTWGCKDERWITLTVLKSLYWNWKFLFQCMHWLPQVVATRIFLTIASLLELPEASEWTLKAIWFYISAAGTRQEVRNRWFPFTIYFMHLMFTLGAPVNV
jgi:hypothetical protein